MNFSFNSNDKIIWSTTKDISIYENDNNSLCDAQLGAYPICFKGTEIKSE